MRNESIPIARLPDKAECTDLLGNTDKPDRTDNFDGKKKNPDPSAEVKGSGNSCCIVYRKSVADVRKQSSLTCTLNGDCNLTLVLSAGAGYAARQNLSALADALTESCGILVVDLCDLISAELTYLLMSAGNGARRSGLNVFSLVFHNENLLYAAVPPNNFVLI